MIKTYSKYSARLGKPAAIIATLLLSATAPAQAANLYRYIDSQGHPAISNTVPDDAVNRGYEVLSPNGRIIKTIPPAPTAAELEAKKKAAEKQKEAARAAAERKHQDEILLRNYSSPNDAIRELHRQLQEMDSVINVKRGNIAILQAQLSSEQEKAANLQRAGRTVPHSVLAKMQTLEQQIKSIQQEITDQEKEIGQVKQVYRQKVTRLEKLTGEKATIPFDAPATKNPPASQ